MSMCVLAYEVKKDKSRFHPKETCDYYRRRNLVCPYYNSGSKPISKERIVRKVKY